MQFFTRFSIPENLLVCWQQRRSCLIRPRKVSTASSLTVTQDGPFLHTKHDAHATGCAECGPQTPLEKQTAWGCSIRFLGEKQFQLILERRDIEEIAFHNYSLGSFLRQFDYHIAEVWEKILILMWVKVNL